MSVTVLKRTPGYRWGIYSVVAECGEGDFVVKVGVSSAPHERYATLLPGIPFPSVMLYTMVFGKKMAFLLEKQAHKAFSERHTIGEWFRFKLEDKSEFHDTMRLLYERQTERPLEWATITNDSVNEYLKQKKANRDSYKSRRDDFERFRIGNAS